MPDAQFLGIEWMIGLCLITFFAFTVASTLGVGGPLILLPVLMLQFSPAQSVMMIVPPMFLNNLARLWVFRKSLKKKAAFYMLLTAVPCALGASFFTGEVAPEIIKSLVIAMIAIVLLLRYLFSVQWVLGFRGLFAWGVPVGAISGLSGTAGPPMAIAMRGYGLVLQQFVATTALVQACLQMVRMPVYLSSGIVSPNYWELSLVMAVCAVPSVFLSREILKRMRPEPFRKGLDLLLGLIGLAMVGSLFSG